jgi:hypothetical protein
MFTLRWPRLAEHLGEGGVTKGDLGVCSATSMSTKHLAVVGSWLICKPRAIHSQARHALTELSFKIQ